MVVAKHGVDLIPGMADHEVTLVTVELDLQCRKASTTDSTLSRSVSTRVPSRSKRIAARKDMVPR